MIAAGVIFILFQFGIYHIKEPDHTAERSNEKKGMAELKALAKKAARLVTSSPPVWVSLIASFLVSLSLVFTNTFLLLWITDQVETGHFVTEAEAKTFY
jgi:hypothetical protein